MSNDILNNDSKNKNSFIKLDTVSNDNCCGGDCGDACVCCSDMDNCCGGSCDECECACC